MNVLVVEIRYVFATRVYPKVSSHMSQKYPSHFLSIFSYFIRKAIRIVVLSGFPKGNKNNKEIEKHNL